MTESHHHFLNLITNRMALIKDWDGVVDFYYNVFILSRHGRKYGYDVIEKNDLIHVLMRLYSLSSGQNLTHILTTKISPYLNDKDIKGLIGLYLQNTKKEIWIKDVLAMLKCIGVTLDDSAELSQIIACDLRRLDNELNVLAHVTNRELLLCDVQSMYINVRNIVLEAVTRGGCYLRFAHEDLRSDKDIVLVAVKQYGKALQFAHKDLKGYREIVLATVKRTGDALQFASDDLKRDKEIGLAAVKNSGWALEFAHEDLKGNKGIVLAAVKVNGDALRFAHEDLKRDMDVILAVNYD